MSFDSIEGKNVPDKQIHFFGGASNLTIKLMFCAGAVSVAFSC